MKKILNFRNIKDHPAKKHIDRKLIFRIRIFYVVGIILTGLMLLYVAFSVSRTWLFGHWIHGSVLTAFTYSILAGVMIGRIAGMRLKIKNILSDQSIFI